MFRFILIFFCFYIGFFLVASVLNNSTANVFNLALIFACIITIYPYFDVVLEKLSDMVKEKKQQQKCSVASFNDAVANELMRIRSDLVSIRLNQDNYGDDVIPQLLASENYKTPGEWRYARSSNEFLRMYWMCREYSSSFLCELYETPDNIWGRIIINLHDFHANEISNNIFLRELDAEKLKKIHTHKMYKFVKGMSLQVYVYEPNEIGHPDRPRKATILSVNKITKFGDIEIETLTLEIDLDFGEEKIIRTIELKKNTSCELVFDNNDVIKKQSPSPTKLFR